MAGAATAETIGIGVLDADALVQQRRSAAPPVGAGSRITRRGGTPWYPEDYLLLVQGLREQMPLDELARALGRSPAALRTRAVCLIAHPDDELALGRRRNWLALLTAEVLVDPRWDWESRARAWHAARARAYFDSALDDRLEEAWLNGRETLPAIARSVRAREHEIADRCVYIGLARSRRQVAERMGCTPGLLLSRSLLPDHWGADGGGTGPHGRGSTGPGRRDPSQPLLGAFESDWSWPPVLGPFDDVPDDPPGTCEGDGTGWEDDRWEDDLPEDDDLSGMLDPSDPIWRRERWTGDGPLDPFGEDDRAWAFEPPWEEREELDVLSFGATAPDPRGLWVLTVAAGAWPFHISVHRTRADAADVLDSLAPPPTAPEQDSGGAGGASGGAGTGAQLCHWSIARREVAAGPDGDLEEGTFSRAAA